MSDWLRLHGVTRAQCLGLLDQSRSATRPTLTDPRVTLAAPWALVTDALQSALPQAAGILDTVRTSVSVDLAPDLARFPRPFTLHDGGTGHPFVSCPLRGRLSDILILAHELGHACQVLTAPSAQVPPAQREGAACLAEWCVTSVLTPEFAALPGLQNARDLRSVDRTAQILRKALADDASPYFYDWNYPVARIAARFAATTLSAERQWQVFDGSLTLSDLVDMALAK